MELAFLALTTTPPRAPAVSDVTLPFRATGACAHPQAAESTTARPAARLENRSLVRIAFSPLRSLNAKWALPGARWLFFADQSGAASSGHAPKARWPRWYGAFGISASCFGRTPEAS